MLCSSSISRNVCFLLFFGITLFMLLRLVDFVLNTTLFRHAGLSIWFITPPLLLIAINTKEVLTLNKKTMQSISILYALIPCVIILFMTFVYALALIADDSPNLVKRLEVLPTIIIGTISFCSIGGVATYILLTRGSRAIALKTKASALKKQGKMR